MKLNAQVVLNILEEKGVKQIEVCKATGIEDYNFSRYLHGFNIPRRKAQDIADYLGVSLFEIQLFKGLSDY